MRCHSFPHETPCAWHRTALTHFLMLTHLLMQCAEKIRAACNAYNATGVAICKRANEAKNRADEAKTAAAKAVRDAQDAVIAATGAARHLAQYNAEVPAVNARSKALQEELELTIIRLPEQIYASVQKRVQAAVPFLNKEMVASGGCLQPEPMPLSAWASNSPVRLLSQPPAGADVAVVVMCPLTWL